MKQSLMIIMGLILSGTFMTTAMAQEKAATPEIGRRIIITGCLHRGSSLDNFVLLGVTERPANASEPIVPVPIAIYWLDSTDGLKGLVGELVDITGTVTERTSKSGTITLAIDPSDLPDVQVGSSLFGFDVEMRHNQI